MTPLSSTLNPLHPDFVVSADGLPTLSPAGARLARALDFRFLRMALAAGAEERQFPTVIAEETLTRSEYFQSFPGCASNVSHPKLKGRYFLSTAVCYHVYQLLMNSALAGDTLITCCGKCFRADAADDNHLWEFTMREIVFLGSAGFVCEQREAWKEKIAGWAARLGLRVDLAPASDPFFGAETRGKKAMQQLKELKYELTASSLPGLGIPIASFNLHERFFASRFEITLRSGDLVHTGCVAFGLERWIISLIARHGVNGALRLVEGSDDLR